MIYLLKWEKIKIYVKVINQCKLWWKLGYAELHCVLNVDLEVKEYFKFVKLEYNYIKQYDN